MPCLLLWLQSFKCQRMRIWPGGRVPGPALLGPSPQLHGQVIQTLLNNNCQCLQQVQQLHSPRSHLRCFCDAWCRLAWAQALLRAWHRGDLRNARHRMTRWRGMVASITIQHLLTHNQCAPTTIVNTTSSVAHLVVSRAPAGGAQTSMQRVPRLKSSPT